MDTGILGLLTKGGLLFYTVHIIAGGLFSGEKGLYSRSAPFCSISSWDQGRGLCLFPAATHPFPSLRKNAAPSSEHSWAQQNSSATALLLEAVGDKAAENRVKMSWAQAQPQPSPLQLSGVVQSKCHYVEWNKRSSLEEDNTVCSQARGMEQSKSRTHGAVWTIQFFGGLSLTVSHWLKLGEGEH